ncbi:HK97 family phage prohead protease [Parahaliea mediterranea]|uniref:HK97 family phage prohead protease n=1 Tax=Parahaliea mediterranea TaxID=651086 RepID=UPI001300928D|nr:HK97 family phage prohead protease [Parahaliea mediterranea]
MGQRNADATILKAGTQSEDDPFEFILSDERVDRHGDIVRADGWKLADFKKNPIALFGHSHSQIIGVWTNVRVEGKKLVGRLKLAEEGTSELVNTTRKLVEQRILKAVSVGFRILEYTPRDKNEPWGGWDITQADLMEASMVAVPANAGALAIAKALSPSTADILFARPGTTEGGPEIDPGRATFETQTPNLDTWRERAKALGIS